MPTPLEALQEKHSRYQKESGEMMDRIKQFAVGTVKAVTTDIPGLAADLVDKLSGQTKVFGENERSGQFFERLTGIKSTGSPQEIIGGLMQPENAVKAMIVGAARLGKATRLVDTVAAETQKARGVSNADVFDNTGVYVDKDLGRKTVLSDKDSALMPSAVMTRKDGTFGLRNFSDTLLPDVLIHPELYALYPKLRTTTVRLNSSLESGTANYFPGSNIITINSTKSADHFRSMLLHEIQHGVQEIEGFTRGGSQKLPFDLTKLRERIGILSKSPKLADQQNAKALQEYGQKKAVEAYETYKKIPGEQEARFTESTRNLDQDNLAAKVLELLRQGDTPQDQLIVK